jgi:hypothetical protein
MAKPEALLAVDVGNTQTVFGLFSDGSLTEHWRVATEAHRTGDELGALVSRFIDLDSVDGICLSSTVPALIREYEVFAERWAKASLLVVGPGVRTGIGIRYDDPREVGPTASPTPSPRARSTARRASSSTSARPRTSTSSRRRASTSAACSRPGSRSPWRRSSPARRGS